MPGLRGCTAETLRHAMTHGNMRVERRVHPAPAMAPSVMVRELGGTTRTPRGQGKGG